MPEEEKHSDDHEEQFDDFEGDLEPDESDEGSDVDFKALWEEERQRNERLQKKLGDQGNEIGRLRKSTTGQESLPVEAPLGDFDDDDYLTGKQAKSLVGGMMNQFLDTLKTVGTKTSTMSKLEKLGLSEEQMSEVEQFADDQGIPDLEYAAFKLGFLHSASNSPGKKQLTKEIRNSDVSRTPTRRGRDKKRRGKELPDMTQQEYETFMAGKTPEQRRQIIRQEIMRRAASE